MSLIKVSVKAGQNPYTIPANRSLLDERPLRRIIVVTTKAMYQRAPSNSLSIHHRIRLNKEDGLSRTGVVSDGPSGPMVSTEGITE
jgi:DNA topoisomerase VI subunit A